MLNACCYVPAEIDKHVRGLTYILETNATDILLRHLAKLFDYPQTTMYMH